MASARRVLTGAAVLALSGALAGPAVAAFPGVNGKIAFSRNGQITLKDFGDLTGGAALTSMGDNEDPAWTADGLRIAFTSDRTGSVQVWTMNANGSNQTQFSFEGGDTAAPAWSPDGTKIAYGVSNGTDSDVVVRDLTNGSRLVVAGGTGDQKLPVFTADGSKVIFEDSSTGGLSIVGAGGAGRAPFLSDAAQPDVSPDGTKILVRRTDIERLQVVNSDGSGGTPLLNGEPATRPVFSPDGTRIIFHRSGFPGPASHLFQFPSSGASSSTQESTPTTLDFSADWQPIGAFPAITGFPQALVAGAPGATLTVDGRGFAFRSVVRWNGADRPTRWVSPTRVTASLTAADVARPGNATVTVFTSPSGGGLSAPATVTIPAPPPPPPRILLGTSKLSKVKWVASRARGTLRVTGTLEAAGRVEVALLRNRRVLQRTVLRLPAGAFSRSIALGPRVVPGKLTLRMQGTGGSTLVPVTRTITLPAPPEGVAEAAFISALQRGPAASTLRDKSRIFATFRFAVLPKGNRRLTTRWVPPGQSPLAPDGKPRRKVVTSFISSRGQLPTGVWRCELRAGGKLVASATVRLR